MAIDIDEYYRQYGPMVVRRCRYLLKDEDEAYDAMQDVFVKLIRSRDRLKDDNPTALLLRIATNVCLNRIRSRKRKPEDGDGDLLERIADATDGEKASAARSVLDRLFKGEQESTQTIAVLHLLDGLTLEETAAEVGMSVSGVRKRLRNLSKHLRELEGTAI